MTRFIRSALIGACLWPVQAALAATVSIQISDSDGTPAAQAVVALEPHSQQTLLPSRLAQNAVVDQRNEMFIPLVTLIRQGGQVVFTNNDTTMHQVYSFSPIRQFEFEIDQGRKSQPVTFDKPGVAAIGCNIHDQMIAYVYVADTPYVAVTDAKGYATITDVPDGAWRVTVWHPRLPPGKTAPSASLAVAGAPASLSLAIPLAGTMPGKKRMHMGDY